MVYISMPGERFDHSVWMVATDASYEKLIEDTAQDLDAKEPLKNTSETADTMSRNLTIYERSGSYAHIWYKRRSIKVPSLSSKPEQTIMIDEIRSKYYSKGYAVVVLHGPPGSGKSVMSILLANSFGGSYCNTLKPWQPGDTLASLYSESANSIHKPIIIAFDEFDEALVAIHGGIESHKNLPIQVNSKAGWNQLLDEIQLGMYPNIILMLTTNKTPEFIRELDPSYIRNGRVDLSYILTNVYI